VREVETAADVHHHADLLLDGEKRSLGTRTWPRSRPSISSIGDEEGPFNLAELVDGDDVRVQEPGRGSGLALEARAGRRVAAARATVFRADAVEVRVQRPVTSHRALAQLGQDLELSDSS